MKIFSPKQTNDKVESDDPVALAEAMLSETEEILKESESIMGQVNDLSPEEQSWMEWFISLPEDQKQIVDVCRKNGIDVNENNLQAVLEKIAEPQQ